MDYKIMKAEFQFSSKDRKLETITVLAEMPHNPKDVRLIEAKRSNMFWTQDFNSNESVLHTILQKVAGYGSEV